MALPQPFDLAVIGGGVNGCGIARDAAGRGLRVWLCEQGDLAQATSSASTKLFHGGLRYLEYYEFRLVREALQERETLLRAMPHISWPLRFVLPHHAGLRPRWMLRAGLFMYDHLGGRKILPGTETLDLRKHPAGGPLKPEFSRGFEYSDCWVDDARLVVLNARDAAARGARIYTRRKAVSARREGGLWRLTSEDAAAGARHEVTAKALVNAGGPWVERILTGVAEAKPPAKIRLVRGSHIVVRRLYDHDRAYILQNADGRIIFLIPYEQDFTLVGTTDAEHTGEPGGARCTPEEADYLRKAASEYLKKPIAAADVVWSYAGVRPLYDDGASSATAATRDYVLHVAHEGGAAPLLSVFGGKITTYRRLAEGALDKLKPFFPGLKPAWTAGAALPGGNFPVAEAAEALPRRLMEAHPFLSPALARRLTRLYGTEATKILAGARRMEDLGRDFGAGLTEAELSHMMRHEWARTAEDALWRRSKMGLRLSAEQAAAVEDWMKGEAARLMAEERAA